MSGIFRLRLLVEVVETGYEKRKLLLGSRYARLN